MTDLTYLFVSGMFRSGTTLLSRLLNAHKEICVASDPYFEVFRAFRNDLAAETETAVQSDQQLQEYYFDTDGMRLFDAIQEASFNRPLDASGLPELRRRIKRRGEPFSPLMMGDIDAFAGTTYRDALLSGLNLVETHYGTPGLRVIGHKEVWTDEFIPALARAFPNAKFIQILRDPRAVCASKNVAKEQYPWLFLARQWRKLAALAWDYQTTENFLADRVLLLPYEDLVKEPEKECRRICAFLGIEYDAGMTKPAGFVDGRGQSWQQNTSYGTGEKGFDTSKIEKWREVLDDSEVAHIERLCGLEMRLHGYSPTHLDATSEIAHPPYPRIYDDRIAAWLKPLYPNDPLTIQSELAKETMRAALLTISDDELPNWERSIIDGCFLKSSVLDAGRKIGRIAA